MLGRWTIDCWPTLGFDVFLSHCAEDRRRLVIPVFQQLRDLRLSPWLDQHHYPSSTDPFEALRDQLVRCRHVVYFITPNLLKQGRGWCAAERSYAELVQRHFQYAASTLWTYEIPLIFTHCDDERLRRSTWAPLLPKARWYALRSTPRMSKSSWAVREIKAVLQQQHATISATEVQIAADSQLQGFLAGFPGLRERLTSRLPDPLI
jgi:hypothetical protein